MRDIFGDTLLYIIGITFPPCIVFVVLDTICKSLFTNAWATAGIPIGGAIVFSILWPLLVNRILRKQ